MKGVLTGNHYNRSVRAHKLLYEALHRLLWEEYLDSLPETKSLEVSNSVLELQAIFPHEEFQDISHSDDFAGLLNEFNEFMNQRSEESSTFEYWCSYLTMVGHLMFIKAAREGKWELHLSALRRMISGFFAYDRTIYARYAPIYMLEIVNLKTTHPDIHEDMSNGGFVFQWT
ncbi:uncharacterized protein LOC143025475 [Oratosquilla oratoria]|uniref:uncharacterized protein LOC143025475 n=1 Tax=Oratosquilla oratoria TaxID=337810 RepID=UPI003F769D26